MRKFSVLALGAMVFAVPAMAGSHPGSTSSFGLVGTADFGGALPTTDIMVGPDIAGGIFLVADTVVDMSALGDLSNDILAPAGGVIDIFLRASVSDDSAGLFSFTATMDSTNPAVQFTSGLLYDTTFQDVPGRMSAFAGLDSAIPDVRRFAGDVTANGHFEQTLTSPFAAADGSSGNPTSIAEAGASGSSLVTASDAQTFGIGQVGNDQTTGPSILGRFTIEVPVPAEGADPQTYVVDLTIVSSINWVEDPQFGDPIIPNQIEAASEVSTMSLTITVPEPTTALLLLPAAAIIRRRRR